MPYDAITVPVTIEQRAASPVDAALADGAITLCDRQHEAGYWCFELEADCTIPAEYILMMHYMGEVDTELQAKLAVYLRARQLSQGGWPLYEGGPMDISCSVKTYYALKLAGDEPGAAHMAKARTAILAQGGAARCNVFTRITLALFGQLPWRGVPFMPVELLLLPRWFPFHISKVAYWSRTVMVPLLILCSAKPRARNPNHVHMGELFITPPEEEPYYFPIRSPLNRFFLALDYLGRRLEPLIPRRLRNRAVARAEAWFVERLNSADGLGAIFPAMVNAYQALDYLGYQPDHPHRQNAKRALRDLISTHTDLAYCQPCVSPIWDTALACRALQEIDSEEAWRATRSGLDWLVKQQILDAPGDWRESRPQLKGGGWAFQFRNDHYPDLDDTAAVAWALEVAEESRYRPAIDRAVDWLCGMQSKNGGFASFDVDNTYYYLNHIPFADHGALLDPPSADVSARCATLLGRVVRRRPDDRYRQALARCLDYLRQQQEPKGCWFGRWGTNYIYGTWSVLVAFEEAGVCPNDSSVTRAAQWLERMQHHDGGWGESNDTYANPAQAGQGESSTAFQTAWALLGLMAAGKVHSPAVRRGIDYLLRSQRDDGLWIDKSFTAPGFPRVFYLKYHGYSYYFPLWALARYRKLQGAGCP